MGLPSHILLKRANFLELGLPPHALFLGDLPKAMWLRGNAPYLKKNYIFYKKAFYAYSRFLICLRQWDKVLKYSYHYN